MWEGLRSVSFSVYLNWYNLFSIYVFSLLFKLRWLQQALQPQCETLEGLTLTLCQRHISTNINIINMINIIEITVWDLGSFNIDGLARRSAPMSVLHLGGKISCHVLESLQIFSGKYISFQPESLRGLGPLPQPRHRLRPPQCLGRRLVELGWCPRAQEARNCRLCAQGLGDTYIKIKRRKL